MKAKSLLDQWVDLKEDFPRHIVLIQCGVFYETYQEDAFIFLSVQADLGVAQACHPSPGTKIARVRVPKLKSNPRPFKVLL